MRNPYYSREGVKALTEILKEGRVSDDVLVQLFQGLVYYPTRADLICLKDPSKAIFIGAMTGILDESYTRIIDIACGNGALSHVLAQKNPNAEVLGIDIDAQIVQKAKQQQLSNLSYQERDAFCLNEKADLLVGLHTCGDLTERILDMARKNKSTALCVPCCYAKGEPTTILRSYAAKLEGHMPRGRGRLLQDCVRIATNIERMLPLLEEGYDGKIIQLVPSTTKANLSPQRYACLCIPQTTP